MKTEIINNKKISRLKWDAFTTNSSNGHIFNFSWYLDIVFPEWQALIISDENEWIAVLPLFPQKKYGFNITLQPLLIRYSGVIKKDCAFNQDQLQKLTKKALSKFSICHFTSQFDFLPEKMQKKKVIQKLDISLSYNHIFAGFKKSLRNKINHFDTHSLSIYEDKTASALIHLFHHYDEIGKFKAPKDYLEKLEVLYTVALGKKMARIVTVRNIEQEIVASILFFYFGDTIYLFSGLIKKEYKETGIKPYLLNLEIKNLSGKYKTFNFLGSSIPGVAMFNKSFGAVPWYYREQIFKKFPFNLLPV